MPSEVNKSKIDPAYKAKQESTETNCIESTRVHQKLINPYLQA